ncbi:MAG: hypothetical protein K2J11_08835, partial [Oscillospiraceae bacterium]|nr:hypothetical protein [Oscillospiraceae bacterium]
TAAKKKEVKPLSPSRSQAYFQNDEFSVTAELTALQSSLYYPDILHDMGINPELFVVTVTVKAKNMTEEEKSFDVSKFTLPDLISYGDESGQFKDIKPGKSEIGELRFLCSLEQAAAIDGILYGGEYLEEGDDFYPEEFDEIIDIQSADDVAEYFYRTHVFHAYKGYFEVAATPTTYEMHHLRGIKDGEKNYLAVSFTAYNRSDYAQLIEPSCFIIFCCGYKGEAEIVERQTVHRPNGGYSVVYNEPKLEGLEPLYISVDESLVYAPAEAGVKLDGVGTVYELPEYICMTPENPTEFTIIYDLKNYSRARFLSFNGSHGGEKYYSALYENGYGFFDWDVWKKDYVDKTAD